MKRSKRIDYDFCEEVMMRLLDAEYWLSDGIREMKGFASRIELCGVGIRIFLSNGGKVIWRMSRQNAEFINIASLFATKENA